MPANDTELSASRLEQSGGSAVTPLELFFDLVFVFTITQLTTLLVREPSWTGVFQVVVLFGNVWWMYGGYAWLTNHVPPRELGVRLLLLVGMGGFLIIALSLPTAFAGGGAAFGFGYLIVTLVHTGIFLRTSQQSVVRSMLGLGPFNLLSAGLLLAGGLSGAPWRGVLFTAGVVLHWITPFIARPSGFRLRARHFVERHGLILLIAVGESVVAVGIGLGAIALPVGRIATALLGLALAAALWWLYFAGEERRAELAFERATPAENPWLALNAFGYAFFPLLAGVVAIAAGTKLAIVRYNQPEPLSASLFLAAGVATYLLGLVLFRIFVKNGRLLVRVSIGIAALPTALIGIAVSAIAQLAVLTALLIVGIMLDALVD